MRRVLLLTLMFLLVMCVPVTDAGLYVKSHLYSSLELADDAAVASGKQLLITSKHTLTEDVVVGASVRVLMGSGFVQGGDYLITIDGAFDPSGFQQVFYGFSKDQIVFKRGTISRVTPELCGAVGDGVTDDAEAINVCASAARPFGVPFYFSQNYLVTDSLDFTGTPGGWYGYGVLRGNHGWQVYGAGQYISNIYAKLTEAYPVFDFTGTAKIHFHDIHISGDPEGNQSAGILVAMDGLSNRGLSPTIARVEIDGEYEKVGLANVSADLSKIDQSSIVGPVGVFYGYTDVLEVGSKYRTFTTLPGQNTLHTIVGGGIQGSESSAILDDSGGQINAYGSVLSLRGTATSVIKTTGPNHAPIYFYGCRTETLSSAENTYILDAQQAPKSGYISGSYVVNGVGPALHVPPGQSLQNFIWQATLGTFFSEKPFLFGGGGTMINNTIYDGQGSNGEVALTGSRNNVVYSVNPIPWENFINPFVANMWHGGQTTYFGGNLEVSKDVFSRGTKLD